jgi:hypothetical protein
MNISKILTKKGEVRRGGEDELLKLVWQKYLKLREASPTEKDFNLGVEAVGNVDDTLNDIIEKRYPESVDYLMVDMVDFFINPMEMMIVSDMGKDPKLRKGQFNTAKVKQFLGYTPAKRKGFYACELSKKGKKEAENNATV